MLHFQAVPYKDYMKKYYRAATWNLNMGGLTLVLPIAFSWGIELITTIHRFLAHLTDMATKWHQ